MSKEPAKGESEFHVSIGGRSFDPKEAVEHARRRATAAKRRQKRVAARARREAPAEAPPEPTIVQFTQVLRPEDAARLRDEYGLKLDQHVPSLAYLERVPPGTLRRLRRDPLVRASIPYHPELKLAPSIGAAAAPAAGAPVRNEFVATLFDDADTAPVQSALDSIGARDVRVHDDRAIGGRARVRFVLDDAGRLPLLADVPDVVWIEPVAPSKADNGEAACTIQGGGSATHPIWDHGLHGEGQVIGVLDPSGPLDINHCFFADSVPPGPAHRKVVALRDVSGTGAGRHATFVSGCAAGDERGSPGSNRHRGGAWAAKLASGNQQDVGINSLFFELTAGLGAGAFIHSNSWHDTTNGVGNPALYTQNAADVDTFTWNNEDHLVLGSGGNNGEELGPPGTAKNAICVNAAQSDPNEMNFGDGNTGPTADLRRKPDLMAVGCGIQSSLLGTGCGTGPASACATSYATPHAAAAATLVRQYFLEGWYPSGEKEARNAITPTGALLKAVLLNSTIDMTGVAGYPSATEGWGIIRLDRTLYFRGDPRNLRVWDVRHAAGITAVDIRTHDLDVADGAEQLKVTLVWTEPPPAAAAFANPVVNDLDLKVTAPDGTEYRGNDLVNGVSRPNSTTTDNLNNVEIVVVNNPPVGKWTLEVAGAVHVGNPGQGYALVATASLKPKCFVASAVYGDPWNPDVQFIRAWRDRVLSGGGIARAAMLGLGALYERIGPPLADVVRRHPRLGSVLRERVFRPAVARARARRETRQAEGAGRWP